MHDLSLVFFALMPAGPGGEGPGLFGQLLPLIAIFGIFYFLLIRPQSQQRKQHEAMLQNLKKGDRVITTGGIHGTIAGLNGDILKLRVADSVSLQVSRSAVATKLGEETE